MQHTNYIDRLMTYGLCAVIACAALMQGAVETWSLAALEFALLILTAIWMVKSYADKKLLIEFPATFYPVASLLIFSVIQSLTWTGENGEIRSLSFVPDATQTVTSMLIFLVLGHLIAANFFARKENYKRAANFLAFFGFGLAVLAILQYFAEDGSFLWIIPAEPFASGGVTGTFVNHNHFAGFLEMIIPLPLALLLTGAAGSKKLLYGFAAAVMTLALVLSLSRGAMISITCGIVVTVACCLIYQQRTKSIENASGIQVRGARRKQTAMILAGTLTLISAVIIGTFWLGIDPVLTRISNNEVLSSEESATTFRDSRGWIWNNTISIFRDNWSVGTGLGSFETVYPNYSANDEALSVNRAHNDYLQILSDAGIVGGILCVWFSLALIRTAVRALRETDLQRAAFAIGSIGCATALAVHSLFDFNLQIPSNALLFLALTGALAGISAAVPVRSNSTINDRRAAEPEDELYAFGVSS